jgi:hypothetical protein
LAVLESQHWFPFDWRKFIKWFVGRIVFPNCDTNLQGITQDVIRYTQCN